MLPVIAFIFFLTILFSIAFIFFASRKDDRTLNIVGSLSKSFGALLVPIVVVVFGFIFQNKVASFDQRLHQQRLDLDKEISSLNKALEFQKHDIAIIQEFQKIYFQPTKRKLALSYIDLIQDKNTRFNLREFFMWDTLYSTIRKPENKGAKYRYNPDNPIWGSFSWNLTKMKSEGKDEKQYNEYINSVLNIYAPHEFNEYAPLKEVYKIFQWPNH